MTGHTLDPVERWAVWAAHGEVCWLCKKHVAFGDMHVDHAVPQHLRDKPEELAGVIHGLGLPESFGIDSYENWRPSHGSCNGAKSASTLLDEPIWAVQIKKGLKKAERARTLEKAKRQESDVAAAIATIVAAADGGRLDQAHAALLEPSLSMFVKAHVATRAPETRSEPIGLAAGFEVLLDDGTLRVVRGAYGIGAGPSKPMPSARCGVCGAAEFNGARCILCGAMNDD